MTENRTKMTVRKSNNLVRSSYQMSLSEQRLMTLLFAQLRSDQIEYEVCTQSYADAFNVEPHSAIEAMTDAATQLQTRIFTHITADDPARVQSISWVQTCTYFHDQSRVGIKLGEDILPFLFDLKTHFTTYPLIDASKLTSVYAFRVFEIARSYLSLGSFEISVESFRTTLKLSDEYRQGDIQTKIIQPAINQINNKTPIELKYEVVKQGRDVVGYSFVVKKKPQLVKTKPTKPTKGELHSVLPAFKEF